MVLAICSLFGLSFKLFMLLPDNLSVEQVLLLLIAAVLVASDAEGEAEEHNGDCNDDR